MRTDVAVLLVLPVLWLGAAGARAQGTGGAEPATPAAGADVRPGPAPDSADGQAGASEADAEADAGVAAAVGSGPPLEEVVVRGRSRGALRLQIELAEEAVYDRFNEINSRDEFDIHCYSEAVTGSRLLRRDCRANFWRTAQSHAGTESLRAMRGESAIDGSTFLSEAMYKSKLLATEMRELAGEDDQLQDALTRLARLTESVGDDATASAGGAAARTASSDVAAGEGELPYDAAAITDVRIGSDPWRHELARRTFSIANVYGQITSMQLNCAEASGALRFEAGAEWTVPDGWTGCELEVGAPGGTLFSFYEFD